MNLLKGTLINKLLLMASKVKLSMLNSINQLVLSDFAFSEEQKEIWNSNENQKKLGGVVGLKPREVVNGPQRNLSAYLFFCKEQRPTILAENPGIKPNQVMTLFGQKWRPLTNEEKKPFVQMAQADKARYEESKQRNRQKPPKAPNTKQTAYILFSNEERLNIKKEMPDLSTTETIKELGRRWRLAKQENPEKLIEKFGYVPPKQTNSNETL
jgi:hypothetical protein